MVRRWSGFFNKTIRPGPRGTIVDESENVVEELFASGLARYPAMMSALESFRDLVQDHAVMVLDERLEDLTRAVDREPSRNRKTQKYLHERTIGVGRYLGGQKDSDLEFAVWVHWHEGDEEDS